MHGSEKSPLRLEECIVVLLHNGKVDQNECGISVLGVPGKEYGRILIESIQADRIENKRGTGTGGGWGVLKSEDGAVLCIR